MPLLFTVKWPRVAQLEASLMSPVAVAVAGQLAAVHAGFGGGLKALMPFGDNPSGEVAPDVPLVGLAFLVAVPFLGLLVAVDRLLVVRKGFAILSCLATVLWAGAAAILSDGLAIPSGLAALLVGAGSLAAHGKILWIGLTDTGFAAMQMGVERRVKGDTPGRYTGEGYPPPEADDRDDPAKKARKRRRGLPGDIDHLRTPIETILVLIMISGWMYGAYRWIYSVDRRPEASTTASVEPGSSSLAMPDAPAIDGAASTARDGSGRFVFGTTVNGVSMAMIYDDDVPLVTLRAEDALRIGISFPRLDFADKIKTDNGTMEVAGITISSMTVGSITYRLVPGYVARPGALDHSILGHSFLGRLATSRVQNNRISVTGTR